MTSQSDLEFEDQKLIAELAWLVPENAWAEITFSSICPHYTLRIGVKGDFGSIFILPGNSRFELIAAARQWVAHNPGKFDCAAGKRAKLAQLYEEARRLEQELEGK